MNASLNQYILATKLSANQLNMELNLKRPLAFFDLETTGLSITNDRIVEISLLKIHPNGSQESMTYLLNPEIPIPAAITKIHGISDADVKDKPVFADIARDLSRFLDNCDLAGYNVIKFDLPMLVEAFIRADIDFDIKNRQIIDVQNIFMKMEPRTLKGAYRFFCNKELTDAHSAKADTLATFEILKAQLERYEGADFEDRDGNISQPVVNDVKQLHAFSSHHRNADLNGQIIYNEAGKETFNFGKHKGKTVEEVFEFEPSYYDWMMKGDFPGYTKKLITAIKLRSFGKQVSMSNNKNF
jgi:DNA polymerase III subunit epsilon